MAFARGDGGQRVEGVGGDRLHAAGRSRHAAGILAERHLGPDPRAGRGRRLPLQVDRDDAREAGERVHRVRLPEVGLGARVIELRADDHASGRSPLSYSGCRMSGGKTLSVAAFVAIVLAVMGLAKTGGILATGPIGWSIQGAAVALMVWARVTFGGRSFHFAANPTAGGLVTWGPYRFVRHPIYASILLFIAVSLVDSSDGGKRRARPGRAGGNLGAHAQRGDAGGGPVPGVPRVRARHPPPHPRRLVTPTSRTSRAAARRRRSLSARRRTRSDPTRDSDTGTRSSA